MKMVDPIVPGLTALVAFSPNKANPQSCRGVSCKARDSGFENIIKSLQAGLRTLDVGEEQSRTAYRNTRLFHIYVVPPLRKLGSFGMTFGAWGLSGSKTGWYEEDMPPILIQGTPDKYWVRSSRFWACSAGRFHRIGISISYVDPTLPCALIVAWNRRARFIVNTLDILGRRD
jgi:hypothetical protein